MSSVDVTQPDMAVYQRCLDAVASCEPDVDRLRAVLMRSVLSLSGADGVALFEFDRTDVVCRAAIEACAPLVHLRLPRARTVVGSAATAMSPVEVEVSATPDAADAGRCQELGLTTMLLVPLRRGNRVNGVLVAGTRGGAGNRLMTSDDVLQSVVQVGAARLEHLELASERAAKEQLLAAVAEAGRAVLAAEAPAQALCDWARKLTAAPYASFVEPTGEGELTLTAQSGAGLPPLKLRLDEPSLAGAAFVSGRAQVVHDYKRHPEVLARVIDVIAGAGLSEPRAAAYIPVRTAQQTLGVVCLLLDEPFALQTMTVLGLLSRLASEAALAIDRDRLRGELERQASTDSLTTVANRRTHVTRLSLELARANRSHTPLSLVLVDIDHFKSYNDRQGHQAGDALLRTVCSRWLAQTRETDLLARLGGDEFALILPETNVADASALCQRLLAALPDDVTASAGLAQWNGEEDQLAFYRRCDEALYDAKNSGRNRTSTAV